MIRRRGRPGLLGTVARTAVVAGTASATAGAVNHHQAQKQAEKQASADQQAPPPQAEYQAPPPQPVDQASPPPVSAPASAPADDDLVGKIQQLVGLRDAGVLSEAEFSAAKGKLLGI